MINAGILPLTFENEADYELIAQGDQLTLSDIHTALEKDGRVTVRNQTTGKEIPCLCELSDRAKAILLAGGLLNYTKEQLQ